jgi:hypothetical protein
MMDFVNHFNSTVYPLYFGNTLEPIATVEKHRGRNFWTKTEAEAASLPPAAVLGSSELEVLYQKMSSAGLLAPGTTRERFLAEMDKKEQVVAPSDLEIDY